MYIEDRHSPRICINCKSIIPDGIEYRIGKKMWHFFRWVCKHEVTLVCSDCIKLSNHYKCSVCGNDCSYT